MNFKKDLKDFYDESGEERGGFITNEGDVIEVKNVHPDKKECFMFSCDDLDRLDKDDVIATFHTHPNKSANLSKDDYDAFLNWEKLLHFIVGKDKINCYKVSERGTLVAVPVGD